MEYLIQASLWFNLEDSVELISVFFVALTLALRDSPDSLPLLNSASCCGEELSLLAVCMIHAKPLLHTGVYCVFGSKVIEKYDISQVTLSKIAQGDGAMRCGVCG